MKNNLYCFILIIGSLIINQNIIAQGSGFSATAINWDIPTTGGYIFTTGGVATNYGFNGLASSTGFDDGSQAWSTMDINGDDKPDLVVYAERQNGKNFPFNNKSQWKVYLNTGSGFSTTAINWNIPTTGGYIFTTGGVATNYGFNGLASSTGYDDGSQAWSTMDINGDNKPDLVVYAERQNGKNFPFNNKSQWKIYLNTGSGFSTTATNWNIPTTGGYIFTTGGVTTNYGFNGLASSAGYNDGSQAWSTMDINGDDKPDLVVYVERQNGKNFPFNNKSQWKVYLNTSVSNVSVKQVNDPMSEISIYPNPTSGNFNIELKKEQELKIQVLNSLGVEVLNTKTTKFDKKIPIDLNQYPSGVYFIKIINLEQQFDTFRVVKK